MNQAFQSLKNKNILVTGAAGGIGSAITGVFHHHGANLFLADVAEEGLKALQNQYPADQGKVFSQVCDISQEGQVLELFQAFDQVFDSMDVLVNVPFAFPSRVRPHELAREDWEKTWSVCTTGYLLCSQQAIRRMLPAGKGCILNIGSIAGISALGRGNLPYSAAKAAVHQMTREMALEYARDGIRVNAVLPAQVLTPGLKPLLEDPRFAESIRSQTEAGIPIGRLLDPEEVAYPAAFLCTDAASAITGVLLPVDGGNLAMNAGGSIVWPDL